MKNGIPELLNENDRCFDVMLLGRTANSPATQGKVLDLRSPRRNLFTDLLVLLRYLDFMSNGATVLISLDGLDTSHLFSKKISHFDRRLLHIVTLMQVDKCRSRLIERVTTKLDTLLAKRCYKAYRTEESCTSYINSYVDSIVPLQRVCTDNQLVLSVSLYNYSAKEQQLLTKTLSEMDVQVH